MNKRSGVLQRVSRNIGECHSTWGVVNHLTVSRDLRSLPRFTLPGVLSNLLQFVLDAH